MQWISLALCLGSFGVLLTVHGADVKDTVHGADGKECYACTHVGCGDWFVPDSMDVIKVACAGSCVKTKNGDSVNRTCLPILKDDDCETNGDTTSCFCTGNLCNAGTRTIAFPVLLMGILTLVPRIM